MHGRDRENPSPSATRIVRTASAGRESAANLARPTLRRLSGSAFCASSSEKSARPKTITRRGMAQNHLADRSDQRASSAAARSHLRRLHRHRQTATTDHGNSTPPARWNKEIAAILNQEASLQPAAVPSGAEHLVTAVPLARPDREDQWRRRQSDVLARRQLLGPGGGGGARHHATNRVRLSCARAVDWPPAGKGTALANQPVLTSRSSNCVARLRHTKRSRKEAS